jgi:hypothetical protein
VGVTGALADATTRDTVVVGAFRVELQHPVAEGLRAFTDLRTPGLSCEEGLDVRSFEDADYGSCVAHCALLLGYRDSLLMVSSVARSSSPTMTIPTL